MCALRSPEILLRFFHGSVSSHISIFFVIFLLKYTRNRVQIDRTIWQIQYISNRIGFTLKKNSSLFFFVLALARVWEPLAFLTTVLSGKIFEFVAETRDTRDTMVFTGFSEELGCTLLWQASERNLTAGTPRIDRQLECISRQSSSYSPTLRQCRSSRNSEQARSIFDIHIRKAFYITLSWVADRQRGWRKDVF